MAHSSPQALTPWAAACPLMKKAPSSAAASAMSLGKVIRSFRKKRGKQDHERRPRVIDEHAEADADLGISLKQQQPLHRHGDAGKGNEQKIPLVVHECEAVAGDEKQRQQQAAAQHGAEQHDLIAAQMDEAGHHSVGAEDQQAGKVF